MNIFQRAVARISALEIENKELTDTSFRLEAENRTYLEKLTMIERSMVELDAILKSAEPSKVESSQSFPVPV